jgi:hypothetical protein
MFQIRSGLDIYEPDPLNADPDPGRQINPDPCQVLYVTQTLIIYIKKSLYVGNKFKKYIAIKATLKG